MFSANENAALRQNKRRVIKYVEETIHEDLLDLGVIVLAMQVSCRAPGCVPLETVLTIIFPPSSEELMSGIPESKNAGTFSAKVLLPMSEITKKDVLHSLPPAFEGGLQTTETLCLRARDVMLAQITSLCTSQDSQHFMAQYLQKCLEEFVGAGFKAPEYGQPFPKSQKIDSTIEKPEEENVISEQGEYFLTQSKDGITNNNVGLNKKGNIVIKRNLDETLNCNDGSKRDASKNFSTIKSKQSAIFHRTETENLDTHLPSQSSSIKKYYPSANDWRRQKITERKIDSETLLSKFITAEHSPGIRSPGCPCCNPDGPQNIIDSMMML